MVGCSSSVVSGEAGGITQHVGAYTVVTEGGKPITFVDTPGHAAFSEMRKRGADSTDIVVLVVAADEGVKDQTSDSLAAARQAGKPVIVAFNKVDKEGADVARVASELTGYDLLVESLGGDVLSSEVPPAPTRALFFSAAGHCRPLSSGHSLPRWLIYELTCWPIATSALTLTLTLTPGER